LSDFTKPRDEISNQINILKKNQIQHLKKEGKVTKVSLVFLEVMLESKNLVHILTNIFEEQKDFFEHSRINR